MVPEPGRDAQPAEILLTDIAFGESPRWHDGRLWFCDWAAEEVVAVDAAGGREVIVAVHSFPFSIDWLPDGRLLVNSARDRSLLTLGEDGALVTYSDLGGFGDRLPGNEIVVDRQGNIYLNGAGFDLMSGAEFAPGIVARVAPDGSAREVAGGMHFPNGMAVTPDGSTLIVAESYAKRLTAFSIGEEGSLYDRRVWADLGEGTPDGICLDADGAAWYADVPNQRCVRVREGGEVLETVEVDRGCFACMLGGPDGRTLYIVAREWKGIGSTADGERSGQILTTRAPAPHAGWP